MQSWCRNWILIKIPKLTLGTHPFLSSILRHLHSESLQWEEKGMLDGSFSMLLVKWMEISLHCSWDPFTTIFYLLLCPERLTLYDVFSLASSWVWPMVSPCRRSEKVRVFILWHLPSEAASSGLGQGHCSSYCGLLQVTLHFHILISSPLRSKGVNHSASSNP